MIEEGDTLDMRSYLNEYLRITRSSINTPDAFFREIKYEESIYLKPLAYALISMVVYLAGSLPVSLFLRHYSFREIMEIMQYIFIVFFISSIILFFIMFFAEKVSRGKGNFNQVFKVFCYSTSVLNLSWIIYIITIFLPIIDVGEWKELVFIFILIPIWVDGFFYIYYLIITGISVISEVSRSRLLAVAFISIIFLLALISSGLYLLELSRWHPPDDQPYTPLPTPIPSDTPSYQERNSYQLYALPGSIPILDGILSDSDKWQENGEISIDIKGKQYLISMKHDMENLYILMRWKGSPRWEDNISIYFEQDDLVPDYNINTGRIDRYYLGNNSDPTILIDGHYDSGYVPDEHQDGSIMVGYDTNNGHWVMEWKIPMNSGDRNDIFVNKYPSLVSLSIINEIDGKGGILPPYADKYDPGTWATIKILDEKIQ